jgi:hypothetical protein
VRADGSVIAWGRNDNGQTNVPAGLSNVVAVAAGLAHNLALRADGILAAWGNNSAGQTNVPSNLVNVAALSAGNYNTFTIANRRPNASVFNITAPANRDRTLTLSGFDAENEPLVSRITALPAAGALFQYTINGRGAPILAAETLVTDSSKRVIFAPLPDTFGTPYATLKYVVHDGITDSADGIVNLSIQPPPPPVITSLGVISN